MHVFIDIDGTLCWSNLPVFLDECNKRFHFQIDQVTLETIPDKKTFFALPEVQAVRSIRQYLDDEMAWIEFRERCLLASLVMKNAVEGVKQLAEYGAITYCTARYCCLPDWQEEIERATTQWLKMYQFPEWSNVEYCDKLEGKIQFLLQKAQDESIILIDDSYSRIIKMMEQLQDADYHLLRDRLLIVAMRAEDVIETNLNIIAFSSWKRIDSLVERIHNHGKSTITTVA